MKLRSIIIYSWVILIHFSFNVIHSQTFDIGTNNCVAICKGGQVITWGDNGYGELGIGNGAPLYYYSSVPMTITSGFRPISVSAGDYFSAYVKDDSTLYTWGVNTAGQLGDGTTNNSYIPLKVPGLTSIIKFSGCWNHSLALRANGTVYSWGDNTSGKFGNGTQLSSFVPVQSLISNVSEISAGSMHSLFLKKDSTIWTCGNNAYGQLGLGTTIDQSFPTQIPGLSGIIAIATGRKSSLALKSDGTVWFWGNMYSTYSVTIPTQLSGINNVIAIAGGHESYLALKNDGTVWGWGYSSNVGNFGTGGLPPSGYPHWIFANPVMLNGLSNIVAIKVGYNVSMALKDDGTLWAMGHNSDGELCDGTTQNSSIPVYAVTPCDIYVSIPERKIIAGTTLYPNPAIDKITITSLENLEKIELINITGQILLSEKIRADIHQLNIETITNGIYILSIYNNAGIIKREKVIINR